VMLSNAMWVYDYCEFEVDEEIIWQKSIHVKLIELFQSLAIKKKSLNWWI